MEVVVVDEGRDEFSRGELEACCCIVGVLIGKPQGQAVQLFWYAA